MSYTHIILTVEPKYNKQAIYFADVMQERGQICDVDNRVIGIHKKLDRAEKLNYDFIHVINYLEHEICHLNVRYNKYKKYIGSKHFIDFMHELQLGKYESSKYTHEKKSRKERRRKNPNDKKHDIDEEKPEYGEEESY